MSNNLIIKIKLLKTFMIPRRRDQAFIKELTKLVPIKGDQCKQEILP